MKQTKAKYTEDEKKSLWHARYGNNSAKCAFKIHVSFSQWICVRVIDTENVCVCLCVWRFKVRGSNKHQRVREKPTSNSELSELQFVYVRYFNRCRSRCKWPFSIQQRRLPPNLANTYIPRTNRFVSFFLFNLLGIVNDCSWNSTPLVVINIQNMQCECFLVFQRQTIDFIA